MPKKRIRPAVARPDPGDERATLQLLWMRTDYLRMCWTDAAKDAINAVGAEHATELESGYGLPIWVLVTMHLASLYTVVEGWQRLRLSAPAVDRVLADATKLERLRHLRHGTFHFGAVNRPEVMDVLSDTAMLSWARDLHEALRAFFE